ncbi:mechanosensitive ion channel domain-containing protein [Motiliproteus sp. SC1-56]|uniref:mechanosensitive ion channel domain-containing protein n=1 Tax=Motiliproteus sp. SC1-56 TaxID=2799565 RepID=UPI001F5D90ED|nr:mechanosensitive ion channel domain-containing protein [Motiliproteus sp. SC1-56]
MDPLMAVQALATLGVIIAYLVLNQLSRSLLATSARNKGVPSKRAHYVQACFRFGWLFLALVAGALIWSVDFRGLLVFASSLFAVVGVALFAQWSLLSNITASIVIFFSFPHRIGDPVKILDGDNTVVGVIDEISLFQVQLISPEGERISYPNSLILQRPVVRLKELPAPAAGDAGP